MQDLELKKANKYGTLLYTFDETSDTNEELTMSVDMEEQAQTGYSASASLNLSSSHNLPLSPNTSGLDLCSSDPAKLYARDASGSSSSLSGSIDCDLALSQRIDALSDAEARKWLMEYPNPKELLRKLARGESVAVDIRKSIGPDLSSVPVSDCPWNERFQALLELEDSQAKFAALSNVGNDFASAAAVFGRIIIEELFVPFDQKTIKPLSMGGLHGGLKYVVHGILFKFCLAGMSENDLFGSDANAMKTAGNELKALVSIFNAGVGSGNCENAEIRNLRLPLMCLVDFRGYRVLAMAVLPISAGTLRYGSSDGGKQVHDDDQEMARAIKQLATVLGLKKHRVGSQNLYLCGDVEGHRGTDGRMYLIDLSRVFPPEFPPNNSPFCKNDIWFKLLRAECVRSYPSPLSSDALSAWGAAGTARENNMEVKKASLWLREVLVPQAALEIERTVKEGTNSTFRVRTVLHRHGVNMRHLGLVRKNTELEAARDLLMSEIIARTIKCDINLKLRQLVAELRLPVDQPYRHLIVNSLNVILGRDQATTSSTLRKSEKRASFVFWTVELREQILAKFGESSLSDQEMTEGYDLRQSIAITGVVALIRRVLGFLGIVLTRKSQSELVSNPRTFSFVLPDVMTWHPKVKMASFLENYTGQMLVSHAETLAGSEESMRLFDGADQSFQRAVSNSATNVRAYESWGSVSFKLGDLWCERSCVVGDEASNNAKYHFDRMAQAWSAAIALDSHRVNEAWDCARRLKSSSEGAGMDESRRKTYLFGAIGLYLALMRNQTLRESNNFLFELGDVCRAAAVDDTGCKMTSEELIRLAASSWQVVFEVDLEKRFHLWDLVVHDNPTKSDRIFLASMIMMAEHSVDLFEDLLQVFYGRPAADFSETAISETAFSNLASSERFCLSSLNVSGCKKLSADVVLNLSQSCDFLVDLRISGVTVRDVEVRLLCKRFKLLERFDVSRCNQVTDASLPCLAQLPYLNSLWMTGCDLSDHGLLETLLPNRHLYNTEMFPSLNLFDCRHVQRISYASIKKLQEAKKLKLLHTTIPSFMEWFGDRPSQKCCDFAEDGRLVLFGNNAEAHMVRANAIIPSKLETLFYFEVSCVHPGVDGAIGLGIAPRGHSGSGMPGWNMQSIGYHGDDGNRFSGFGRQEHGQHGQPGHGIPFGPCWGLNDRAGLGLRRHDTEDGPTFDIFATKNGIFIDFLFKSMKIEEDYYPVVGSVSAGAKMRVYFDAKDFLFDLSEIDKK